MHIISTFKKSVLTIDQLYLIPFSLKGDIRCLIGLVLIPSQDTVFPNINRTVYNHHHFFFQQCIESGFGHRIEIDPIHLINLSPISCDQDSKNDLTGCLTKKLIGIHVGIFIENDTNQSIWITC